MTQDALIALLRSRKVLVALVALIQSLVFAYWPHFPPAVWQAIDALAAALILGIAVEDAGAKASGTFRHADAAGRQAERDE